MNRYTISRHPYLDKYYQVFDNYQGKVIYIGSYFSCKQFYNK